MATATDYRPQYWLARSRAWIGIAILAPFAGVTLVSAPTVLEGGWSDYHFDTLGWLAFAAGSAIRWWATLYIGGRKSRALACAGPYSLCRNPLYLGTFLMGMAIVLFMKSWVLLLGFALATLFYLRVTVPVEEERLRERLGAEYIAYCKRVPRFWPRLTAFHTPGVIEVNVRGLAAEAYRAARWVWLPVACELVEHLRTESWWPRLLYLP
jgi:protein-S-isoprenylcysteine O-methyltransferase Ste14